MQPSTAQAQMQAGMAVVEDMADMAAAEPEQAPRYCHSSKACRQMLQELRP